jgi:hypothetical protein
MRALKNYGMNDYSYKNGFIDREGTFYGCNFAQHSRLLFAIGKDDVEVEKLGWIKITTNEVIGEYAIFLECKDPSQAQINRYRQWCDFWEANGEEMNAWKTFVRRFLL